MAELKRNLSAVACRVGMHVYPSQAFIGNVLHCHIPHRMRKGDLVAPVILRDEVFHRAYNQTVTLANGVEVRLEPHHVIPVSSSLQLHTIYTHNRLVTIPAEHSILHHPRHITPSTPPEYFPRHRICLMTQIAVFANLLPDWISYHRRIGIDHVYIFDNGMPKHMTNTLRDRSDVEIVPWPYHKSQQPLISYFLFLARTRCEYVYIADVDEFGMFGLGTSEEFAHKKPMHAYMDYVLKQGFTNVKIPYLLMKNSGYRKKQLAPLPIAYTHRKERQHFSNGKSVCRTNLPWQSGLIHSCGRINHVLADAFRDKRIWYAKEWNDTTTRPGRHIDGAYVLHFRERSWEDWVEKARAGSGSFRTVDVAAILEADEAPSAYLETPKELEYTFFRGVYERVMNEGTESRFAVWERDGRRCEVVYDMDQDLGGGRLACWNIRRSDMLGQVPS